MAKPFTSHDGVDPNGVRAEVHVQTGTGTIKELAENGNNVQVKMSVEGLKHPIGGWTSKSENIYPLLVEAYEQGREISYRIESQRKQGVDRTIPIAELRKTMDSAKDTTLNVFVGIDGTLSKEAVTDPSEDPYAGGRIPATDSRNKQQAAPAGGAGGAGGGFSAEQALAGLANARQGGLPQTIVDSAAALALAAGASVEQVLAAGVEPQGDNAQRPVQRVVAKEAAPYVAYNTDGRVNLGSYAVQAAVGAETLAAELMHAHAIEVAERHNAAVAAGEVEGETIDPQPINFRNAAALGSILLDLADRVQVGTYGGGRPDRMATSHTRARGFVYDSVKNRNPVPFGQDSETQEVWKRAVVEEGITRFKLAVKIATEIADMPQPVDEQAEQQAPAQQPVAEQAPTQQAPTQQAPAQQPVAEQAPVEQPVQQPVQQPVAEQPVAEQPVAEVRQIGSTTAQKPKVLIEGEEGFVAPTAEVIERFRALASAAGFEPKPDSPISVYLNHKFGVTAARKVHGETLDTLIGWYEQQGEAGPAKFHAHVLAEAGQAASA